MEAHSASDLSSSPSAPPADSPPPPSSPPPRRKKRAPVAPDAVTKGYLGYTKRRGRRGRRIPPRLAQRDRSEYVKIPDGSSSNGDRSLETSPTVETRLRKVSLECNEPPPNSSSGDLGHIEVGSASQVTTFHQLPPELRLLIFKEVLRVPEVEQPIPAVEIPSLDRVHPTFVNVSQQRKGDKDDSVLKVLEVCRFFYHEALPIFYEVNLLRVSSPAMLYSFLNDLPSSRRRYIRRLRVGGIGFHYSSWQLLGKAFSILHLCNHLEHLELELAWQQTADVGFPLWSHALGGRSGGPTAHTEEACKGIQRGTVCLKAIRGLKSIRFQMVGDENPLLPELYEKCSRLSSFEDFKKTVLSWAINTRSIVTWTGALERAQIASWLQRAST